MKTLSEEIGFVYDYEVKEKDQIREGFRVGVFEFGKVKEFIKDIKELHSIKILTKEIREYIIREIEERAGKDLIQPLGKVEQKEK